MPVGKHRSSLTQQAWRERDCGDSDRDVDEEDRGPGEVRGQDPSEEDTGRRTASRGGAVDAERDYALPTLGERRKEQRERGRSQQGSTEPLQSAECDERALGP